MKKYILALDQGTTSSRCIVFDMKTGSAVSSYSKEFKQIFPQDGWVEHDPFDILDSQLISVKSAISLAGIDTNDIAGIGITNQRETSVIWDKNTGKPIYNAIVWQCRRTAKYCDELKNGAMAKVIKSKTGLIPDSYFSASKIKWMLENVPDAYEKASSGELMFGTVDSWLIYNLTGGKVHATDLSNASRTMLFNINSLEWDDELLELMNIPRAIMPRVLPSCHIFGYTDSSAVGFNVPIAGVAGDQQAALFGQGCFKAGEVKNTYGTGGFMLMNTGEKPVYSDNGLLTTVAWGLDNKVYYALEGSTFICGAAVQWLRDGLKILDSSAQSEESALSVPDCGGVYFVPAFVGLGAPYWDPYARGMIIGITRSTTRGHISRAVLESMAYQTLDVLKIMEKESHMDISSLFVDGGACANDLLMSFQADILNIPIIRPSYIESTAYGAASLAALCVGIAASPEDLNKLRISDKIFEPSMLADERALKIKKWNEAVKRASGWAE